MAKLDNTNVHPFDIEPGWLLVELVPKDDPKGLVLPGTVKEDRKQMSVKVIDYGKYPEDGDFAKEYAEANAKLENFIGRTIIHLLLHPSHPNYSAHPFYAVDYGKRHFAFIRPDDIIASYKKDAPVLN